MRIEIRISRGPRRAFALAISLLAFGCGDDDGAAPAADGGTTEPGASGDVCGPDQPCGEGLVCASGKCAAGAALALTVDPAARGCEVLLADTADAKVAEARFAGEVKGSFVRRAPKLGVAFISAKDAAIAGDQVSLAVAGTGTPKLERSRCVDAAGKALAKASVQVVKP